MATRIETSYPLTLTTDGSVSVRAEGGVTTVTIEGAAVDAPPVREAPRPAAPPEPEEPPQPPRSNEPRCGALMARSGKPCARRKGHNGVHMNAEQVARKKDYNKRRARERYNEDPEYAEHVRSQVRASFARRHGDQVTNS